MAPPPDFDPVLLSQVRLGVLAVLVSRESATFPELKALLGATQGNLGVHLGRLAEAGYVEVRREIVGRATRTTARLAPAGRRAIERHLAALTGALVRPSPSPASAARSPRGGRARDTASRTPAR